MSRLCGGWLLLTADKGLTWGPAVRLAPPLPNAALPVPCPGFLWVSASLAGECITSLLSVGAAQGFLLGSTRAVMESFHSVLGVENCVPSALTDLGIFQIREVKMGRHRQIA